MAGNDWKNRLGIVYSTNPSFNYNATKESEESETLNTSQQKLIVKIDRRHRGGKQVTLVTGFTGKESDLEVLGKELKRRCGTGGSVKDMEIIIQGDFRDKILSILNSLGYKAKRGN